MDATVMIRLRGPIAEEGKGEAAGEEGVVCFRLTWKDAVLQMDHACNIVEPSTIWTRLPNFVAEKYSSMERCVA